MTRKSSYEVHLIPWRPMILFIRSSSDKAKSSYEAHLIEGEVSGGSYIVHKKKGSYVSSCKQV